jgi:hypothetical protein
MMAYGILVLPGDAGLRRPRGFRFTATCPPLKADRGPGGADYRMQPKGSRQRSGDERLRSVEDVKQVGDFFFL